MNYLLRAIPSWVLAACLLLIMVFMASVEVTQAKRGCANFGHACFGGHGKRAVPEANVGEPEEIPVGIQRPGDAFVGEGSLPQYEIFSRDGGQLDANGISLYLKQQKYREPDDFGQFAAFLRKWLSRRHEDK